ncbi:conserved hypothetical protein [Verticillium alfalfae VaMs.102]|uniref:Uncharacterized protein n=1 Tax=Verticillium alfalfae (strain VaMs.102 / ATCC MYA-4576 / FGSC 10136) TaxID=526221 RepID=C9SIM0_VERA1|nr:conserved hypothetical protein [Verticillium alfalfae VaMs.102]EEY18793.1 conserved hypothetical protein [Verticillium alfalfae VaMs.102]
MALWLCSLAVLSVIAPHYHVSATTSATPPTYSGIQPDSGSARDNARHIFNAVHSAMRQWGSSLNHNGMSFFPATIPQGVLLYHGTTAPDAVTGLEWLAFEIEHAEVFAPLLLERQGPPDHPQNRRRQNGPPETSHLHVSESEKVVVSRPDTPRAQERPTRDGYLHTYRVTRPQRLLYIDGMSGAKCDLGTLDTQDILLRNRTGRAASTRDIEPRPSATWLRSGRSTESSACSRLEVIKCRFEDGMELVSAKKRPQRRAGDLDLNQLEYIRAVAQRYWDIAATRVHVDFSKMVSAFFYPVNLTNPDPKAAEHPRMVFMPWEELESIRTDVAESLSTFEVPQLTESWQGITDMVFSRYSDRLRFMAEKATWDDIRSELNVLLDSFVNYTPSAGPDISAGTRECAEHFLRPVNSSTWQDKLIRVAFETVLTRLCTDLFSVRDIVSKPEEDENTLKKVRIVIRDLMGWLEWTEWRKCSPCDVNEICFVAVWPHGKPEDHYSPSCLNKTQLQDRRGYWREPASHGPRPEPHQRVYQDL